MRSFATSMLAAILGAGLLTAPVTAEERQTLRTDKEMVNYAIGVNIIGNIRKQAVDIDLDLVIQGMKDAHAGKKLLLTDDELRKSISKYYVAVRQNQSKAWSKAAEENKEAGLLFLAENRKKEGVVTLTSGLQYRIVKAGEGKRPSDEDTVECNYRGTLLNGNEFDSSFAGGKPATFRMNEVIPGWREALKLMPVGSKWQLFIPPQLAYGEGGKRGYIGPNATLIFEIELLSII